jgi:threonyl-tRNA synthetase
MFSEKPPKSIMGAIFALALRSMTDFTTKWRLLTGISSHFPSICVLIPWRSPVTNGDYPALEKLSEGAIKEKQRFERLVVSKENLLKMFEVWLPITLGLCVASYYSQYNKYKKYLIETKVPDGTSTTVYRCGPMIDLCAGPHIPHTGRIKAMMVTKSSSSYFLGDQKNDSLQRIYGISFPDKKQLTEYKAFLAEAARRDHRKIAKVGMP